MKNSSLKTLRPSSVTLSGTLLEQAVEHAVPSFPTPPWKDRNSLGFGKVEIGRIGT